MHLEFFIRTKSGSISRKVHLDLTFCYWFTSLHNLNNNKRPIETGLGQPIGLDLPLVRWWGCNQWWKEGYGIPWCGVQYAQAVLSASTWHYSEHTQTQKQHMQKSMAITLHLRAQSSNQGHIQQQRQLNLRWAGIWKSTVPLDCMYLKMSVSKIMAILPFLAI